MNFDPTTDFRRLERSVNLDNCRGTPSSATFVMSSKGKVSFALYDGFDRLRDCLLEACGILSKSHEKWQGLRRCVQSMILAAGSKSFSIRQPIPTLRERVYPPGVSGHAIFMEGNKYMSSTSRL